MPKPGYTHCKCRDCFEIVVSNDVEEPELCDLCDEAQCEEEAECSVPQRFARHDGGFR